MFQTMKKGEGEATFHEGERGESKPGEKVGNFHLSQQVLSMIETHPGQSKSRKIS